MFEFVACLLVVLLAAGLGGLAGPNSWYGTLRKPRWMPPAWVFSLVWTPLYALMGVALWLDWQIRDPEVRTPVLVAFAMQLALNVAWSWLFFRFRWPGIALAELVALWFGVLLTTTWSYGAVPLAGFFMAPYLVWVTFAMALNFRVWWLNRD